MSVERRAVPPALLIRRLEERDLLVLAKDVARRHHCTVAEMVSDSKVLHIRRARDEFVLALRHMGWSSTGIADLLNRDHTMALDACRRAEGATRREPLRVVAGGQK